MVYFNKNKIIKQNNIKKENNYDLLKKTQSTINSLFEVEHFLYNFEKLIKTIKLYKLLK